jgi:hypothetical protein
MQRIVSQDPRGPFSICQGVFGAWCDYLLPFTGADHVRQAKDIENNSMVAQLLKAEATSGQDRDSYEQGIKDSATSGFLGKKVNRMLSRSSIDLVLPSL